jgi:hypothetical protein
MRTEATWRHRRAVVVNVSGPETSYKPAARGLFSVQQRPDLGRANLYGKDQDLGAAPWLTMLDEQHAF